MFSLFSLLLYVFIDVRLSHLNKDYLLTYLCLFSLKPQRLKFDQRRTVRPTFSLLNPCKIYEGLGEMSASIRVEPVIKHLIYF